MKNRIKKWFISIIIVQVIIILILLIELIWVTVPFLVWLSKISLAILGIVLLWKFVVKRILDKRRDNRREAFR
ncbi:MAG: hypothetical protein AABW48_02395 [Nanoarchaeota archaeon]